MFTRWEREDWIYFGYLILIIVMVLLIPSVWFYDWLHYAENRRQVIIFLYRVYEWIVT